VPIATVGPFCPEVFPVIAAGAKALSQFNNRPRHARGAKVPARSSRRIVLIAQVEAGKQQRSSQANRPSLSRKAAETLRAAYAPYNHSHPQRATTSDLSSVC